MAMRQAIVAAALCLSSMGVVGAEDLPRPRDSTPGVVVPPVEVPPPNRNGVIERRTPNCDTADTPQAERDRKSDKQSDGTTVCK